MIYVDNSSAYPQRIAIPRDDEATGATHIYQFQSKDYDIDHNGETYIYPDEGYDGITGGTINVHVPTDTQEAYDQGYSDGFSSGVTEGEEIQKAKLGELTATTNGHYTREDGYSDVYVDVQGGGGDVDYILLSQDYITSSAIGVGVNIGVTANTQWVVSDYPDWIIFSPSAGTGTSTFYVQPQANTGESRVGVITLTGGTATRSIVVNQDGFNSYTGNTVSFVLYLGSPDHKSITLFDSSALQYVSGLKIDGASVTPNTVISLPTQKSSNLTWSVEVELNTTEIQAPFFLPEPVDGTATFFWIDNILIGDGITSIDGGIFDFFAPNGQGTAKSPYPSNITIGASITSVTSNFMYIDRYGLRNITSYAVNAPLISADTFVPLDNTKFSNFYVPQCSDYSKWETMLSNAGATYQMHYFDNVMGCSYSDGYDDGFEDGEEAQKGLLGEFTASTNGVYTSETGYSAVTVDVQGGGGTNLTSETFTNNGVYLPSAGTDGWSAITISVPTSAGTIIPFTNASIQTYAAQAIGTYTFQRTANDNIQRLVVNFPTTGATFVTAYFEPDTDKDVKLYDSGQINAITIDDGIPMAATGTTFMTAGLHKVVFDLTYNDAHGLSFSSCRDLKKVDMSETYATGMTDWMFSGTGIEELKMPRCEEVGDNAFWWAFNLDSFTRSDFPLVKSIRTDAFRESSIRVVDVPVEEIYAYAFYECGSLEFVSLFDCKLIAGMAFPHCTALTEIDLPVTSPCTIMHEAFLYCTALTTVNCTSVNVENICIDYRAFKWCSSLSEFKVEANTNPPTVIDDDNGTIGTVDPFTLETNNPFSGVPQTGTVSLWSSMSQNYVQAWTTWAATYLPGWTVQISS